MRKLYFLTFLLMAMAGFAQQEIRIVVKNEADEVIRNAMVVNMRTDQKSTVAGSADIVVMAKEGDILRVVAGNYDRQEFRVDAQSFTKPQLVILQRPATQIEEVKIGPSVSGNLAKDVAALKQSERISTLNADLKKYMVTPPTEVVPRLTAPSTIVLHPKVNGPSVDLIKIAGAVQKLIQKASYGPKLTPNYLETQKFQQWILDNVDKTYYQKLGYDDERLARLIAYADERYSITKNYQRSLNISTIETLLKKSLKDFEIQEADRSGSQLRLKLKNVA